VRVVLDTNALVSGVLSVSAPPGQIVELVVDGALQIVLNPANLAEYEDVLHREELGLRAERVGILLDRIRRGALILTAMPWPHDLPDPDDAPFLAVADAGVCPLVTGNLRHFPVKSRGAVTVLTPREFVDWLRGR